MATFASGGNVGIGTISPNFKLEVQGTASSTIGYFSTLNIPSLATPAGSFLAVNPSGQVIATTTPSGVGGMVYPGAGIALSTGSGWDTSITNNSADWNTAFGWGNHATAGYLLSVNAFTQALASTTFQARNDWTTHDNYPAACTNQFIRQIGDTNTCASVATTDFASANVSQWTNDAGYSTFAYPFPSAATSTPLTFTGLLTMGNASSTQITTTGSTYLATLGGYVGIGTANPIGSLHVASGQILAPGGIAGAPGFSFGGDPDIGIYSDESNVIAMSIGGYNRFTLRDGSVDLPNQWRFAADSSVGLNYLAADKMSIYTNSLNRLTVDAAGNVGIGTTSPYAMFSVAGRGVFDKDVRADFYTATSTLTASQFNLASSTLFTATTAWIPTLLGSIDAGGAFSLEIPNSDSPTFTAGGQIAIDTTSNNFLMSTSSDRGIVIGSATSTLYSFSIASSSSFFSSGKYKELPASPLAQVITGIMCKVSGGTSKVINLSDTGSGDTNSITCGTTWTQTNITTGNSFDAYEAIRLELGNTTGVVDDVVVRILGYKVSN
jgi:hypothetical protein